MVTSADAEHDSTTFSDHRSLRTQMSWTST
jgi:hypothetical protein